MDPKITKTGETHIFRLPTRELLGLFLLAIGPFQQFHCISYKNVLYTAALSDLIKKKSIFHSHCPLSRKSLPVLINNAQSHSVLEQSVPTQKIITQPSLFILFYLEKS